LHAKPKLHAVKVALDDPTTSSSFIAVFSLDSTTFAPVAPSRTNVDFSQQPQISPRQSCMVSSLPSQTKRQLLFEDEMPL
jgi:replication factor A1